MTSSLNVFQLTAIEQSRLARGRCSTLQAIVQQSALHTDTQNCATEYTDAMLHFKAFFYN